MSCACGRNAVVALALSMALATGSHAQTTACDDFKATLAARFESKGVRGYSLEAVPASAPTPSGARVIGNCEAGAYKILYRRWGAAGQASAAAASVAKAQTPDAPARQASSAPSERVSRALPASAPAPTPQKGGRAAASASAVQGSAQAPVPAPATAASEVAAAIPAGQTAIVLAPPPQAQDRPSADAPLARRVVDFAVAHWPWLGALLLLLALPVWIWRTYFSPYDKDGLPRGPRL